MKENMAAAREQCLELFGNVGDDYLERLLGSGALHLLLDANAQPERILRSTLDRDEFRCAIGLASGIPVVDFQISAPSFGRFAKRVDVHDLDDELREQFDVAMKHPVTDVPHAVLAVGFAPDCTPAAIQQVLDEYELHLAFPSDFLGTLYALSAERKQRAAFKGMRLMGGVDQIHFKDWTDLTELPSVPYERLFATGNQRRLVVDQVPVANGIPEGTLVLASSCKHA